MWSRVVLNDALFGGVRPGQPRGPELPEDADTACVGFFPLRCRFSLCLRSGGLWASMRHPVSQGNGAFQVDTETKSSRFGTNSLYELLPIFSSSWYKRVEPEPWVQKVDTTSVHCPVTKLACSQSSGLKNGLGYCRCHGPSGRSSQDGGSFLRVSTCPELTFSFVAFVRDAIAASSFSGAVITWETAPRSGTARTSSQLPRLRVSKRASQVGCCAYWSHGKRTCRYASESMRS